MIKLYRFRISNVERCFINTKQLFAKIKGAMENKKMEAVNGTSLERKFRVEFRVRINNWGSH